MNSRRKTRAKKTNFKPAVFVDFHSAADKEREALPSRPIWSSATSLVDNKPPDVLGGGLPEFDSPGSHVRRSFVNPPCRSRECPDATCLDLWNGVGTGR